jgi:tetratricopeptide (TPR) repeat protein
VSLIRTISIIAWLVLINIAGQSQSASDSLKNILDRRDLADTLRVDVLNSLAWELRHNMPGQSLTYAKEALTLSKEIQYPKGEGEAYTQIGISHTIMGNYPVGLENLLKAVSVFDSVGQLALKANTINNIGNIYQLQGDLSNARKYFEEGLKLRVNLRDTASLYKSYTSLAIVYKDQLQFDSALYFFRRNLSLATQQNDIKKISTASNNIGLIFRNQEKYDSALFFFNKALRLKRVINDEQGIALSYRNIGDVYQFQGDINKALLYYQKSLTLREKIKYNLGLTILLKDMAQLFLDNRQFREAKKYGKRSVAVARDSKMKLEETEALKLLSSIFESAGEPDSALNAYRQYTLLKDSLFNEEKANQVNTLRVQFETERKEKELLDKNKSIQLMELEQASNNKVKTFLIVVTLLLAGLVLLIYSRYKLKLRSEKIAAQKNKEIAEQNRKIEEINKELEKRMLRAQMDPHFIFNSLNSIQHFITLNDKTSALHYLAKFSRLIRQMLENSINTIVTVADEIKLLESYIELESLRFEKKFHYEIKVDSTLDIYNTEIPFMLIQPYVENAIQHGLRHKSREGRLHIQLSHDNGSVLCTVEDNGIGRTGAAIRDNLFQREHSSHGMSLTEQRLELINQMQPRKTWVTIEDLYTPDQHPTGTRVTIIIPKEYDEKEFEPSGFENSNR